MAKHTSLAALGVRAGMKLGGDAASVLAPLEARRLARVDADAPLRAPPVFIVGAPRTGSTVLYQAISNQFQVSYVSNFLALFWRALVTGMDLQSRLFAEQAHNSFQSRYGRTPGWLGPNESGKFWYRWFPKDRHFVPAGSMHLRELRSLRQTLAAITASRAQPMVFKNLNCGQRLQLLQPLFPEALIIFCRRKPLFTAQSIIRMREQLNGDKQRWVSVMPGSIDALLKLPYPVQAVRQVHDLEAQILADWQAFPQAQRMTVWLEDFRDDPQAVLAQVAQLWARNGLLVPQRADALPPPAGGSDRLTLRGEELRLVEQSIAELPW